MQAVVTDPTIQRSGTGAREHSSVLERLSEFRELAKLTDNELGIGFHERKDGTRLLAFANLAKDDIRLVPTRITREQFDAITSNILPIPETRYMMFELAHAYVNRTPIMFEGGTAIGKTFAVNRFADLLYGPRAKIPDFYCSGQTDVSELMGKYVPAGLTPAQLKELDRYLRSDAGAALRAELQEQRGGPVEWTELSERAAMALGLPVNKGSFRFQLGVLPKAMSATMRPDGTMEDTADGPGVLLHIQEVGLAPPAIINALLKIRGERGKLAADIQVHEDGGRLVTGGPDFFIVFSTNPPGKGFKERFEVDSALARALVWKRVPDELSKDSMRLIGSKIFDFSRVGRNQCTAAAIVDLTRTSELAQMLGEVTVKFHQVYTEQLSAGESGRKQRVPATIDSLWKVAEVLQNYQQPNADFSGIDFVKTLKCAIAGHYIDALQDKEPLFPGSTLGAVGAAHRSLGKRLMDSLDQIFTNRATEGFEFRGETRTYAEVIGILEREAIHASIKTPTAPDQDAEAEAVEIREEMEFQQAYSGLIGALGPREAEEFVRSALGDRADEFLDKLIASSRVLEEKR